MTIAPPGADAADGAEVPDAESPGCGAATMCTVPERGEGSASAAVSRIQGVARGAKRVGAARVIDQGYSQADPATEGVDNLGLRDKLVCVSDQLLDAEAVRRRMWADRPSPAIPLLLIAVVVMGGIVVSLLDDSRDGFYFGDPIRLTYWVVASVIAFAATILIARRQGYLTGIWVDRGALVKAGSIALAVVVLVVLFGMGALPGDLTLRGNLPLLALTAGIMVWAYRERRPGLWVVALLLAPLALLANLYNMENLLYRIGVPSFAGADQVVNLAAVALVLVVSAGAFAVSHRRAVREVGRSG
jgi:hypothetical protein